MSTVRIRPCKIGLSNRQVPVLPIAVNNLCVAPKSLLSNRTKSTHASLSPYRSLDQSNMYTVPVLVDVPYIVTSPSFWLALFYAAVADALQVVWAVAHFVRNKTD